MSQVARMFDHRRDGEIGMAGELGIADIALLLAREEARGRSASAEAAASDLTVSDEDALGAGDTAVARQRELGWEGLVAYARALGPDPAFADVDDETLEATVHARAVETSVALARLFEALAEFVVRGIWAEQGCRTPGVWLSWKLGIGASTAREWVRVAVRLRELPRIAARFSDGSLSYSKVRALTRIALPQMQDWLLDWADHATAAELEHIARTLHGVQRARHEPDPDVEDAGWGLSVRSLPGGRAEIRLVGAAVDVYELEDRCRRAAEQARADADAAAGGASAEAGGGASADADGDDEDTPRAPVVSGAETGAVMAQAVLAGTADNPPDTSGLDRHTLVLHTPVDALAASAEAARRPVPVRDASGRVRSLDRQVLRRLACEAGIVVAALDGDGNPLDVGRRKRQVSAALRRAVLLRDRQSCRFPGCGTTRHLHVHHVQHWADGGPTVRDNLITLCAHHHRHLHACHDADRPWQIDLAPDGDHAFRQGRDPSPVPAAGPAPAVAAAARALVAAAPAGGASSASAGSGRRRAARSARTARMGRPRPLRPRPRRRGPPAAPRRGGAARPAHHRRLTPGRSERRATMVPPVDRGRPAPRSVRSDARWQAAVHPEAAGADDAGVDARGRDRGLLGQRVLVGWRAGPRCRGRR